jgi:hypothetical protein
VELASAWGGSCMAESCWYCEGFLPIVVVLFLLRDMNRRSRSLLLGSDGACSNSSSRTLIGQGALDGLWGYWDSRRSRCCLNDIFVGV